ncbi:MAG: hypothetical protein R2707_01055 [Acidimicrobiales bacterium]
MTLMSILADHEGLYEMSRMGRAGLVAALMAIAAVVAYRWASPAGSRPWASAAGRLASAGLAVAAVTIGLGLIPREASRGYIICGPPLNLPDSLPAFTNAGADWADSVHCNELMQAPMWWLVLGLLGSAGLFLAARLTSGARSSIDQTLSPVVDRPSADSGAA